MSRQRELDRGDVDAPDGREQPDQGHEPELCEERITQTSLDGRVVAPSRVSVGLRKGLAMRCVA